MDDEAVRLLRSIDRRLALLTVREEREVQMRLNEEILRTEARRAMFNAIDGRRGSPEIARAVGASERAVQMFVKELSDAGLVRAVTRAGRGMSSRRTRSASRSGSCVELVRRSPVSEPGTRSNEGHRRSGRLTTQSGGAIASDASLLGSR